jgi:hypothetical protein
MKEKLILKHRGDFDYFLVSRTDNSEALVASLNPDGEFEYKLSKQKCDEIFGIVNVEELAKEVCDDTISSPYHCYIAGFNKNAELNKDKVFTIEDMKRGCSLIFLALGDGGDITTDEVIESVLSTQQPNEIEVDIIKECPQCQEWGYVSECRNDCNQKFLQPKLDVKGQLILKKI